MSYKEKVLRHDPNAVCYRPTSMLFAVILNPRNWGQMVFEAPSARGAWRRAFERGEELHWRNVEAR